jgi:hypothetical protein
MELVDVEGLEFDLVAIDDEADAVRTEDMIPGESMGRRPWGRQLAPPPHPEVEQGFFYAPAPAWEVLHEKDLAVDSSVSTKHHEGRRWSRQLTYETMHTGMYRKAPGEHIGPFGGRVTHANIHRPAYIVEDAKERMNAALRVAARRFYKHPGKLEAERHKLQVELVLNSVLLRHLGKRAVATKPKLLQHD